MVKKKKIITTKVKKKKWFPIMAPKTFNEALLGETHLVDSTKLKDKFLKSNLSVITRNPRDQNVNLLFKVISVKDNKGLTKTMVYEILPSFIKRYVRRDKSKVVDSFIVLDKEKQRIRVKPLIVSHNIISKSQKSEIRRKTKKFLIDYISKINLDQFISELIKKEFQKKLKSELKKTSPLRFAEIRKVGYEKINLPTKTLEVEDEETVEELKAEEVKEDSKQEIEIVSSEDKKE
jgi:small subunit ribosomal protein S3Ae